MKKINSYYELDSELNKVNLNKVLDDITEICKTELLDTPRTTEKAQNLILEWWNNLKQKAEIGNHKLSYFCLDNLRKLYKKKIKKYKN
jgi:hypothetical protein